MAENIAHSECGRVHGPQWLKWLGHLAGHPVAGLEIGTFEGDSAEWMLENIFQHIDSRYHCIDPFTGSVEHKIAEARGELPVKLAELEATTRAKLERFPQATIHKGYSQDVLPTLRKASFDAIYVDGDHSSRGALRDGVMAFELLKPEGIMFFDDYAWTVMPDELDRPKIGIEAFLMAYEKHLEVLEPIGWQLAIRKTDHPKSRERAPVVVNARRMHEEWLKKRGKP